LEAEKLQQGPLLLSKDCKEGIAAFQEKREAVFTGA
jgi:enoyl-CoA hydratase/carnithine racemase